MKRSTRDCQTRLQTRSLIGTATLFAGLCLSTGGLRAEGGVIDPDAFAGLPVSRPLEMDALRGQDGDTRITVQSTQDLSASVTGSTFNVGTLNSGAVSIGEHALDNFSGVGLFNIVTGNNNAVNAGIGITFNLQ
ncbi:MAG: hypothetical protein WCY26_08595 [Thiohalobacteraceae bacterium]